MACLRIALIVCVMALLGSGDGALAHHSFAAFDTKKEVWISGTVVEVQYTNPHAWVFLDIADSEGKTETWAIEAGGPNILMRMGWKKNTIRAGDQIKALINPMRDSSKKGGSLVKFVLSDGMEISG